MASCADILGLWKLSLIVWDGAMGQPEEIEEDGQIRVFRDPQTGQLKGEHIKTGIPNVPVTVTCTDTNGIVRIKFTRVNGQTNTEYTGRVIFHVLKDAFIVVKGRVKRRTQNGKRTNVDNGDGDWTTEKPT